jgi:hypothetical protein
VIEHESVVVIHDFSDHPKEFPLAWAFDTIEAFDRFRFRRQREGRKGWMLRAETNQRALANVAAR